MISFEKFQGAGNDFIILNDVKENLDSLSELAMNICDRHFGVGADGMMIVRKSKLADVEMLFFNADGSRASMCGNGIRCFAKYVYDKNLVDKKIFTVETLAGIIGVELVKNKQAVDEVKVNLGQALFDTSKFPIDTDKAEFIEESVQINKRNYKLSVLFIGTIHTVVFMKNLDQVDISTLGESIENLSLFPEKTNVNFCQVIDEENLKVITWERGVGKTLACGTGSAASALVSSIVNKTSKDINIITLGGILKINQRKSGVYMTGEAEAICKGYYNNKKGV